MPGIGVVNANAEGQWTFLQIVQRYVELCGIATSSGALLPTTVENQIGELRRAVNNCCEAWFDIQNFRQNWRFKRDTFSFPTVAGQLEYSYAQAGISPGTFQKFNLKTFRNYPTAVGRSGEIYMDHIPYDDWRDIWDFGANRLTPSRPYQFTITPSNGIGLGPGPSDGWTIWGQYYRGPVRMVVDDDVPELPYQHSPMIIVYHAMINYGYFEAAGEVIQLANKKYPELLANLELDQLDTIEVTGALA